MNTERTFALDDKALIVAALDKWIRQRPGLDFGNYGDVSAYRSEMRSITKDGTEAKRLLRAVEQRDGITAHMLLEASRSAFSGRLTLVDKGDSVAIDYCTGQYWPTEYRRAACAVLASAIWSYWRADMTDDDPKMSMGDRLRRNARLEFGRGIASRWFN